MSHEPLHLLIVEDDADLLRLVGNAAIAEGMRVTCVTARWSAEAALARETFDVAVVDLGLGAESGFDILRLINASYPDTSVVVMSANASISSAIRSYEMAAFAYVQKPFDVDTLLQTVTRACEHRRMTAHNRRMLWELQTINEVADGIAHSLQLDDVLHGALNRLCSALGVPNAAVRLKNEATGTFEVAAVVGPEEIRRVWTANGGSVPRPSDSVIVTGRPVVIEDIAAIVGATPAESLPVRSAVSVPMIVSDELIGTLSLTYAFPRRFSQADQRLLMTIASQIGGSVQSARLHAVVHEAQRDWAQTFDAIADPIGVYDREGRLVRGNAALAVHLASTVSSLAGRRCGDVGFCGGGCPACAVGTAATAARRDEITRPDGQIFSVTTFPMAGAGRGAVVQVAKNVTAEIVSARRMRAMSDELAAANRRSMAAIVQLKTTQAQLVQAEKLSAIGQLVAGVAHELNNPLTSVIGYAQLLEEEVRSGASQDTEALTSDLRRIADESERAARIVRNLLAFARRQAAEREPHDLSDLFARTVALREYALRTMGIEVAKEFASDLPHAVVDASQVQQALLNLILNAEQAMRGRDVRRLRVGARFDEAAGAIELFASDTGHGIDKANMTRIFDPFFTTRDVGEGTGLGLSICYGIVRDHGGQIVVRSAVQEGTTFSILLPARLADPGHHGPVLVACAEGGDYQAVATALEAWGTHVVLVHSSSAALREYTAKTFSRVFVEGGLVSEDVDAWRTARARDVTRTPLVLMGLVDAAHLGGFGREEAIAVLAPPFELRALRSAARATQECV